jgi:hypothetical protein
VPHRSGQTDEFLMDRRLLSADCEISGEDRLPNSIIATLYQLLSAQPGWLQLMSAIHWHGDKTILLIADRPHLSPAAHR